MDTVSPWVNLLLIVLPCHFILQGVRFCYTEILNCKAQTFLNCYGIRPVNYCTKFKFTLSASKLSDVLETRTHICCLSRAVYALYGSAYAAAAIHIKQQQHESIRYRNCVSL